MEEVIANLLSIHDVHDDTSAEHTGKTGLNGEFLLENTVGREVGGHYWVVGSQLFRR